MRKKSENERGENENMSEERVSSWLIGRNYVSLKDKIDEV